MNQEEDLADLRKQFVFTSLCFATAGLIGVYLPHRLAKYADHIHDDYRKLAAYVVARESGGESEIPWRN